MPEAKVLKLETYLPLQLATESQDEYLKPARKKFMNLKFYFKKCAHTGNNRLKHISFETNQPLTKICSTDHDRHDDPITLVTDHHHNYGFVSV